MFKRITAPKKRLKKRFMVYLSCILGIGLLAQASPQVEHDALHYEVEVTAQIIPVFAVDKKGNPVYDLKTGDIQLYVNKKPCKILRFYSYQVEGEEVKENVSPEKIKTESLSKEEIKPVESLQKFNIKIPERINFIILDGITTSISGVKNAKKLAMSIVKSGGPGDAFIIMQASPSRGFKHIMGPEKDKTKLLLALEQIYERPSWILMVPAKSVGRVADASSPGGRDLAGVLGQMAFFEKLDYGDRYRQELRRFSKSLQELKYALKTIRLPKTIFLVSGGIQEFIGDDQYYNQTQLHLVTYYDTMKQATKDINKGGSLLYLVNPIPETHRIRKVITMMSRISNAKCISGSNVDDLLKQIKNNTAAYYEVAFSITPELGENFRIEVKCKRKGVILNTLQHSEKAKPYAQMEEIQKKLFALNVATGGSWSRMVGKVQKTTYQTTKQTQNKEAIVKTVDINIPKELQNRNADIFMLNIHPETLKADIQIIQRKVNPKETLELEAQPGKKQYIVIVEPEKTHCIYTQVS